MQHQLLGGAPPTHDYQARASNAVARSVLEPFQNSLPRSVDPSSKLGDLICRIEAAKSVQSVSMKIWPTRSPQTLPTCLFPRKTCQVALSSTISLLSAWQETYRRQSGIFPLTCS